jgi:hypothetical protein
MESNVRIIRKNSQTPTGLYYTNLIGRAITTYNSRETSYLQPSEQMLVFDDISKIKLEEAHGDTVVVVLKSGGAMPYRVGAWLQKRCLTGSLFSVSVYEKTLC